MSSETEDVAYDDGYEAGHEAGAEAERDKWRELVKEMEDIVMTNKGSITIGRHSYTFMSSKELNAWLKRAKEAIDESTD